MNVSVILPCYNSARHVADRVKEVSHVLAQTKWSWEIILFDDGSSDRTADICRQLAGPSIRFFASPSNRGRGRNVMEGFAQSQGDVVGFMDVDHSTSAQYLVPAVQAILDHHCGAAEAARTYKLRLQEFPFIAHRWLAHVVYRKLVEIFLGLDGHDTASGFKFFRRDVVEALKKQEMLDGWFWDTEVVAAAHALGHNVAEIPSVFVRTKGMGSTVRFARDSWTQFRDLVLYRWRNRSVSFRRECCKPLR